jgi:hypothetical protein
MFEDTLPNVRSHANIEGAVRVVRKQIDKEHARFLSMSSRRRPGPTAGMGAGLRRDDKDKVISVPDRNRRFASLLLQ